MISLFGVSTLRVCAANVELISNKRRQYISTEAERMFVWQSDFVAAL